MPKTVIEKVPSPHADVKVFKIGGTLGFHEKDTLSKLLQECEKRAITKLVIDFSSLKSLGGGCARILRDAANGGGISIGVAGASETTLKFLKNKGETCRIHFASTIEEAISTMHNDAGGKEPRDTDLCGISQAQSSDMESKENARSDEARRKVPIERQSRDGSTDREQEHRPAAHEPAGNGSERQSANDEFDLPPPSRDAQGIPKVICLGHDADVPPAGSADSDNMPVLDTKDPASLADAENTFLADETSSMRSPGGGRLAKKLFHYDALLSISSEFNRISDVGRLLDTFLLTTMAQVGVEHAAFLELQDDEMVPIAARGIELDQCMPLAMSNEEWNSFAWRKKLEIIEIARSSIGEELRERVESLGFVWVAPLLVYGELRGMVLLGKPIRKSLDEDSFEVLKILIHHASIAYENRRIFEEANYRSLGLIQTLIALIEEKNNLIGGSTFFVANYSYITAKKMHYAEESISELMFGIVLRDIGMIKVSDLILKNPRELNNEEWEIIKQHPIDGTEMLEKMRFSDHAVKIVLHHHERFNGEGYPNNLRGAEIPLGARIVSVVESFAAMLQARPTRPALPLEEALNAIKENWGMRYDPEVVRNFVEIIEEEIRTGEKVRFTASEFFYNRGDLLCRKAFS